MTRYILTCAALLLATPALAQTQVDMNQQAHTARVRAEAALNVQYRATMAAMKQRDGYKAPDAGPGPSYQNALLAAQRAWLVYRDAECVVQGYEFRGGSARPMAIDQCYADLTTARIKTLKTEMWQK